MTKIISAYILMVNILLLFALSACSQRPSKIVQLPDTISVWEQTIRGNFSSQKKMVFDSSRIASFLTRYPVFTTYARDIRTFYSHRQYAFAWFDNGRLIEQANNLANRVLNLQLEGIYKRAPYQRQLDSLLFTGKSGTRKADIELELMLTAQYFAFARLAWTGQEPEISRQVNWFLPHKKVNYEQYLDSLINAPPTEFARDEPVYRQYELLRGYLIKYHTLATQAWPAIKIPTDLKTGDTSKILPVVKQRLFKLEDFTGDTASIVYNNELENAIKQFQYRHGLLVNGILNNETLTELNVPVQKRINQLIVNMERSRWLPVKLDNKYLAVNIPEFKLHVYQGENLLWSCDVVVGQIMHQTSIFYGEIKYIVFSPYWNVPASIVRNELLPAMQRHPDYLAKQHMEITGYRDGLPVIRQRPGPENSLGLIKFDFPNSFSIYLHDTPSKSLFREPSRTFSHGCIRVSEPARLASFLFAEQPEWTSSKIEKYMHAGIERPVTLKRATPVFITYFTAFVDRAGRLNFRRDVYDLDERLLSML